MRRNTRPATLIILFAILASSIAATSAPVDPRIREIGRWPYGAAGTVTWDDDLLYFGTGSVLQVWRFTPPDELDLVSEIRLAETAREIAVVDDLLFIAVGPAGFQIVDVHNPTSPAVVSSTRAHGACLGIAVVDDIAWLAAWRSGVQAFDVSNPARPVRASAVVPALEVISVTAAEDVLWATSDEGLHAIDITDPLDPELVFSEGATEIFRLQVIGDLGYAAASWGGLRIYDLSDPTAPAMINGIHDWEHSTVDVTTDGESAFLSNWEYLSVADVRDLDDLDIVGRVPWVGHGAGRTLSLQGDRLAVAELDVGLHIIDVSSPTEPIIMATTPVPGSNSMTVVHDHLALTGSNRHDQGGFRIIDLTNPEQPTFLGGPVGPDDVVYEDAVVIGGHAYVADYWNGIRIFDIRDPSDPRYLGVFDFPTRGAQAVDEWNGLLLVATLLDGLWILDVTTPESPIEVDRLDLDDQLGGVAVENDVAYVGALHSGLVLVDLTDPSELREINRLDSFRALGLAVENSLAVVSSAHDGLVIVDVSNPFAPTEVGRWDDTWVDTPVMRDNRVAFKTYQHSGRRYSLVILDISDPARPIRRCISRPNSPRPSFFGNHLAVGDIYSGLRILDIDGCFESNPFERFPQPARAE